MQYRKCGIQLNRWSTSLTVLEQQILSLCYCPYCHYSLNLSSSLFFLFPLCMCVCFAFNSMLSDSWHSDRSTRCWRWSLFPQISHHRNTLGQIKKVCVSVNLPVCSVYLSLCLCKCLIICPFRLSVCMYPFSLFLSVWRLFCCSIFSHIKPTAFLFLGSVIWVRQRAFGHTVGRICHQIFSHMTWPFWMY